MEADDASVYMCGKSNYIYLLNNPQWSILRTLFKQSQAAAISIPITTVYILMGVRVYLKNLQPSGYVT